MATTLFQSISAVPGRVYTALGEFVDYATGRKAEREADRNQKDLVDFFSEKLVSAFRAGRIRMLPYYDNLTAETPEHRLAYRWLLKEPVIKSAFMGKLLAVMSLDLQVDPASETPRDKEIAAFVEESLRRCAGGPAEIIWSILFGALLEGNGIAEKVWGRIDRGKYRGRPTIRAVKAKDSHDYQIEIDEFNNPVLVRSRRTNDEYPMSDFTFFSHMAAFSNPIGMSDLRAVYRAGWMLDTVWKLRAIGLERFTLPIFMSKYPQGRNDIRDSINDAVKKAKSLGYLTVPQEAAVEAIEMASKSGSDFDAAIKGLQEECFIAIQGATLQALAGNVTEGRGDSTVHKTTSELFVWYLSCAAATVINDQFIPDIVDLNYADSDYPTTWLGGVNDGDLKSALELDTGLLQLGLVQDPHDLARRYRRQLSNDPQEALATLKLIRQLGAPEQPPPGMGGPPPAPVTPTPAPTGWGVVDDAKDGGGNGGNPPFEKFADEYHGPKPPNDGGKWVQSGKGPNGGLIWTRQPAEQSGGGGGAASEGYSSKHIQDALKQYGGDSGKVFDAYRAKIKQHLAAGGKASIWIDGKQVNIVSADGGTLRDDKGQPWGMMPLAAGKPGSKTGIELHGGAKPPAPASPASPGKPAPTPPQPSTTTQKVDPEQRKQLLTKVRREAHERDLNDAMRANEGVSQHFDISTVPQQVTSQFDGHGTDFNGMVNLLANGVDKNRTFHSATLGASGSAKLLKDSSNFLLLGHPGKTIKDGGIGGVIVDEMHAPNIPDLKKAFPGVAFVPSSKAAGLLSKVASTGNPSGSPVKYVEGFDEAFDDGCYHGPNPPSDGKWKQVGTGPKGGKVWERVSEGEGKQASVTTGSKPEVTRTETWDDGTKVEFAKSPFAMIDRRVEYPKADDVRNAKVTSVSLDDLRGTQGEVTVNGMNKARDDSAGLPIVVKSNGVKYIQDGHHRLSKELLDGGKTAKVRYVDLDGGNDPAEQPTPEAKPARDLSKGKAADRLKPKPEGWGDAAIIPGNTHRGVWNIATSTGYNRAKPLIDEAARIHALGDKATDADVRALAEKIANTSGQDALYTLAQAAGVSGGGGAKAVAQRIVAPLKRDVGELPENDMTKEAALQKAAVKSGVPPAEARKLTAYARQMRDTANKQVDYHNDALKYAYGILSRENGGRSFTQHHPAFEGDQDAVKGFDTAAIEVNAHYPGLFGTLGESGAESRANDSDSQKLWDALAAGPRQRQTINDTFPQVLDDWHHYQSQKKPDGAVPFAEIMQGAGYA